jgi:hypothetical protein
MNEPTPQEGHPSGDGSSSDPVFEEFHGVLLYRGSIPFDQLPFPDPPPEDLDAWNWVDNDPEVQRLNHGLVVAVYNRKVWGVGKTYKAAAEDARQRPGCPEEELIFVPVPATKLPPPSERGGEQQG